MSDQHNSPTRRASERHNRRKSENLKAARASAKNLSMELETPAPLDDSASRPMLESLRVPGELECIDEERSENGSAYSRASKNSRVNKRADVVIKVGLPPHVSPASSV